MPNSIKCKIKHLCHNGTINERERDRILKALEQEPCEDCISRQEAINKMQELEDEDITAYGCEIPEGFDGKRAIRALKTLKPVAPKSKTGVLNKIRAEILEEKECAYADFEQYKVEYLGQEWEDACDSLPQDDFRYGMERCFDIIDRYKAESEDKE